MEFPIKIIPVVFIGAIIIGAIIACINPVPPRQKWCDSFKDNQSKLSERQFQIEFENL